MNTSGVNNFLVNFFKKNLFIRVAYVAQNSLTSLYVRKGYRKRALIFLYEFNKCAYFQFISSNILIFLI